MTITLILKNLVPVAYAKNEAEAKEMVIKETFKNSNFCPDTWEWACRLSNIKAMYSFKEISNNL